MAASKAVPKRTGLKLLMILLFLICVVLSVLAFISWSAHKNEGVPVDFNTIAQDELERGTYVDGTIQYAIGCYAEKYEVDTYYNWRMSDDSEALYYLVPVCKSNVDGTIDIQYFITYSADPEDFDTMDSIIEQTWSDSEAQSLTINYARVGIISDELQQYLTEFINDKSFYENGSFIDWCIEYNILGTTNRAEIASRVTSYSVYKQEKPMSTLAFAFLCVGLAVLFAAIFLVLQLVKRPIMPSLTRPPTEDFSKLHEMDTPS